MQKYSLPFRFFFFFFFFFTSPHLVIDRWLLQRNRLVHYQCHIEVIAEPIDWLDRHRP
jgi:hypothetical protein